MKKALALIILIVTPTMAFAQGTVVLANQTGLVKMWTSQTGTTLISVPKGGGYVELIAAPVGTPLVNPLFSATGLNYSSIAGFLAANPGWDLPSNAAGPGTPGMIGVGVGLFADGTYTINNIGDGANAEYFLIGWTGSATTADAALAGGANAFGESAIFTTATSSPVGTPAPTPVSLRSTFAGMTLGPICLGTYFEGFTAQPTSQTVVLGATATFYVAAAACPSPYFQWYFNGASIPGATDSSLQLSNAQLTNAGTYHVVLSNPYWGVRTSQSATLTVLTKPIITSPPQSQTAFVGANVSFQASAVGPPPLAYRWFFNGSAISGAGSTELQLTNLQLSQAGTYTVVVTNAYGAVTSSPTILTVVASPPTFLILPRNHMAVVGRFVDFVVSAEGSLPLSYQWFFNGSVIAGATGTDLHFTNVQLSQSGNYTVVVTNAFGAITSAPAVFTVSPVASLPAGTVVAWGWNGQGQNDVPSGLGNVIGIAGGADYSLALQVDGGVFAWGNWAGGTTDVPPGLDNVIAIAAGQDHNLALLADGTVVAWGWNDYGQRNVPTGLSNVIAIAAGQFHSLALKADGTVVAWGLNNYGQSTVPAGLSNVIALAGGSGHTLALKADGTVVAWGWNNSGQSSVPAGLSNVIALAAGGFHSLALRADSTVVAWGDNYDGQAVVPAGLNNVISIAAGCYHSLALTAKGTVVAWGLNNYGQSTVPGGLSNSIAIATGYYHNLALVSTTPVLQLSLTSETVEAGSTVEFSVNVTGTMPLSYQWFFDGTSALVGATNSLLKLADVRSEQAGAYAVVASNAFCAVTSAPTMLSVIAPVPKRMLPGLTLLGQPGSLLSLENADALGPSPNWVTFDNVALTNTTQWYFDLSTPLPPQRFYRAWQTDPSNVAPALDLHRVPALTMTGPVGSSVRVDYINQFGPTDAWVALDTVMMTSTSQLYFDVSAPGQPPRLYRLVQVP